MFAGVLFVPAASSSLGSVLTSGFLSSAVDPIDVSIGSVLHSSPADSSFFMLQTNQNKVRDGIEIQTEKKGSVSGLTDVKFSDSPLVSLQS